MDELDKLRLEIAKRKGYEFYQFFWDEKDDPADIPFVVMPGKKPDVELTGPANMRRVYDPKEAEFVGMEHDGPDWPRDIKAAFELIQEMRDDKTNHATFALENGFGDPPGDWEVIAWDRNGEILERFVTFDRVPEAICHAWLAWKEGTA